MKRTLIVGMPGTGKTSVLEALRSRGFRAIETLPETKHADILFLSGCASNQGKFYPRFDLLLCQVCRERSCWNG